MRQPSGLRLGDLFSNRREMGGAGLPVLSVTLNDGLVDRADLDRKQDSSLDPDQHLLVKAGDIAYNTMRMWQGAYGVANTEGLVSPAYVVLCPNEGINSKYASYLFETPRLQHMFWAYSYGLTEDRLRLYFADFARIPVWIPPIEDQCAVVAALEHWDRTLVVVDRLVEVAEEQLRLERAQIIHAAAMHPNARTSALEEVAKMVSGGTPATGRAELWSGDVPWITAKDMKTFFVNSSEVMISQAAKNGLRTVPKGTVLMLTRGMTLLRRVPICVVGQEATFNQDVKALLPVPGVDAEYLAHALKAREPHLLALVDTAGHGTGRLDSDVLKDVPIPVPPISVQKAVAGAISAMERVVRNHQLMRSMLSEERDSLLRKWVGREGTSARAASRRT